MKKTISGLGLVLLGFFAHAQNGLENLTVEKYYVSNAADAAASVGALPVGSVTYRVYADMLPGYKFQAAYGVTGHQLRVQTSTSFFNNQDRGSTTPATFTTAQAADNTVMLDSWFSVGGASADSLGILKADDSGLGNVVNANGVLANADVYAGAALTAKDGFVTGTPEAVTFVGLSAGDLAVFNATSNQGNLFSTTNGSFASLNGSVGPTVDNRVLIGQFTTTGVFSFEFNIQVKNTSTGAVQNFVAANPVGAEISIPSLTYSNETCVTPVTPTSVSTSKICSTTPVFSTPAAGGYTYDWAVSGTTVSITAGQGTNTITASVPSFTAGVSAVLSVASHISFCASPSYTVAIANGSLVVPKEAGKGNGPVLNPCGLMGTLTTTTYSVIPSVTAGVTYKWEHPAFARIIGDSTGSSVAVQFDNFAGGVGSFTVTAVGECFNSVKKSVIKLAPKLSATPKKVTESIKDAKVICSYVGTSNEILYKLDKKVPVATSYAWTIPANTEIVGATNDTVIRVKFNTGYAAAGVVTAMSVTGCGNSAGKALKVLAGVVPVAPIKISGPASVCANLDSTDATYKIAPIFGATSYAWTVPTGATIVGASDGRTITVSYNATTAAGNVTATSVSGCGNSAAATTLAIDLKPSTPSIIGFTDVCLGTTVDYSVDAPVNATSYLWAVNGSAVAATTNSINVTWVKDVKTVAVTVNGCGTSSTTTTVKMKKAKCKMENGALVQVDGSSTELFNVFPNPSTTGNNITVALSGLEVNEGETASIRMYDIMGRNVFTTQTVYNNGISQEINTKAVTPGMYFISVQVGPEVYTQKVIISE